MDRGGGGAVGPKVFCIGFQKTGTTSLSAALKTLGYRVTGPNGIEDPEIGKNVHAMTDKLVPKFDAFQDNPWPIIYRELDAKYPDSKFILTVRDSETWIASLVRHFGRWQTPMRTWIYGVGFPEGNEDVYVERYETHNREVLEYFKDRPHDLLVMELGKEGGWEKLCAFLGKEIPDIPFPHANKAADRRFSITLYRQIVINAKTLRARLRNALNR